MHTLRFAVLPALLLLASPVGVSAQDAPGDGDGVARVMVVGDSHVERLGPMLNRRVEEAGCHGLGSLARRGWSARRYIREGDMLEQLRAGGRPDVVVISLGGNDRPRNIEMYREQLRWVVEQARQSGAQRIVWLGPAASDMERSERARMVGEWHERNADWQAEILPEMGVEWIDSRPFTREGHAVDGIHFTARTYAAWASSAVAAGHFEVAHEPSASEGEPDAGSEAASAETGSSETASVDAVTELTPTDSADNRA